MPNFETFTRTNLKPAANPTLTIDVRGNLRLNGAAVDALGTPTQVDLLWDAHARIVGVRPTTDPDGPTAFRLGKTHSIDGTRIIAAAVFTDHVGLNVAGGQRWTAYVDDGILCADLSRPGTPSTSNRLGTGRT